jgi:hypothetical protein
MHVISALKNLTIMIPSFSSHTTSNNMYKCNNFFILILKLYICYVFLYLYKPHIMQQTTYLSSQFTQYSLDRIHAAKLHKPSHHSFCRIGKSQRAPNHSLSDHYSALQSASTLDMPAPQLYFYGTGTSHRAPNYRVGNRYPASDNSKYLYSLDLPSVLTMLDVPAPPTLDVPARQLPTLDVSAHLAYITRSNSPPLWTLGCITSGPSNPHDPRPSAPVDSGCLQSILTLDMSAQIMLEVMAYLPYIIRSTSPHLWGWSSGHRHTANTQCQVGLF